MNKMEIVLATHNKNKLRELQAMLADTGITVRSLTDIGFTEDIIEDGETFEDNARIKARTISELGYIAVADDSGLCVDALDGAPGVYSARYSGEDCDDDRNNAKLLDALENVSDEKRTASFVSALVLSFPDGREIIAEGRVCGTIIREKRGTDGFGYDPLFYLPEYGRTFAELSPDEKNTISHRGRAMRELKRKLLRLPKQNGKFKLGIYGGTFSPPHAGHLNAIDALLRETDIDALLVLPDGIPPHKKIPDEDDPHRRLEMTRLMLKTHPEYERRLFVFDWELVQKGKSYTYLTLEHFSRFADEIVMLVGTDMLMTLHQWKEPAKICSLASLAFMPRTKSVPEEIEKQIAFLGENFGAKVITLTSEPVECSSTEIRERLRSGGDVSQMLCPEVYEYVKTNHIYGS